MDLTGKKASLIKNSTLEIQHKLTLLCTIMKYKVAHWGKNCSDTLLLVESGCFCMHFPPPG